MKLIFIVIVIILSYSFAHSLEQKRIKYFKDSSEYVLNFIDHDEDGFYEECLFYIVGGEQWQKKIAYQDEETKLDFHTILKYVNSELILVDEGFCHHKYPEEGIFRIFQITNEPLNLSVVIIGGCLFDDEIVIEQPIISSVYSNELTDLMFEYEKRKDHIVISNLDHDINQVSIIDYSGKELLTSNKTSSSEEIFINLNTLTPGVYFITIRLKNGKTLSEIFIK